MTVILAIDPGTTQSGWVLLDGSRILDAAIEDNAAVRARLRDWHDGARVGEVPFLGAVVIERIEPRYGLRMGWETIRTCELVGALCEATGPLPVALLTRSSILRHLGVAIRGSADSGVRAALMDRWGGAASVRKGGPLAGIRTHLWAALAVGVTWAEAPGLAEAVER